MLRVWREIYNYREMLKNSVAKDLRQKYKGSVLGFLWTFLNPVMQLVIFSIVFSTIMRIDLENYSMFLFVGLLPWIFFSTSILNSAGIIVQNANLIKKVYFPREILPLSVCFSGLVNFLLSLLILIPAMVFFDMELKVAIVALPVVIIIQTLMVLGFSFLISGINVYFRDLEHLLGVFMMAWFYLTPIIYPLKLVPDKFLWLVKINPIAPIILAYQDIFYFGIFPDWSSLGRVFILAALLLLLGTSVFGQMKKKFAEEV